MNSHINITVKYNDDILDVQCSKDSTVLDLKNKIYEEFNIKQEMQLLIDENNQMLFYYNKLSKHYDEDVFKIIINVIDFTVIDEDKLAMACIKNEIKVNNDDYEKHGIDTQKLNEIRKNINGN